MTISLSSIPAEISLYLLLNSESVSDSIGYLKISNSLNPYYHPISAVLCYSKRNYQKENKNEVHITVYMEWWVFLVFHNIGQQKLDDSKDLTN